MTETLLSYIEIANEYLWTYVVVTLLVLLALYFTIALRGVQFTHLREMMRCLFSSTDTQATSQTKGKAISSFGAFAVSLSSRVGTGNLAGVASAIAIGGPGAVFWMWVMALLGAATAFVEATLAQLYKRRGSDAFYGGPAYYMHHGLHRPAMGVLFAVLITVTFGLANQLVQSNTLCDALSSATVSDNRLWGILIALTVLSIIFGGIQRISHFASLCVPFMAVGYLLIALVVIGLHWRDLPDLFHLIVCHAFGLTPAAGGVIGMAVLQGVKRGLFSNEAGEGSAPNAAAIATTTHPVTQGFLQALGVFTDTLLICTCTAFIVLLSGLYDNGQDGILLTKAALEHEIGTAGGLFITAAIFLFAFSTIIANYFYGETNLRYICSHAMTTASPRTLRAVIFVFRLVTGFVVGAGAFMTLQTAFSLVDIVMGFMTITNLIAIYLLFPKVKMLLRHYIHQRQTHKPLSFHKETLPESWRNDIECWE